MQYRRGIPELLIALSVLFLALAGTVRAEWTPEARRGYRALEKKTSGWTNGQMAGIWGSVAVHAGAPLRSARFRRLAYRNDVDYAAGSPKVEMLVSRTGRRISPLAVVFPGVFGDAASSGAMMVARQLRRARNHVVIVPNPWGEGFQRSNPTFMPGDFDREAKAMIDLIEAAIGFIGAERISGIHFVGESYGGFLAPATAVAMNRLGIRRVASVTSISVPFHIGNAMEALDRLADEGERAYFDRGCQWKFRNFFRIVGFLFERIAHPDRQEVYVKDGVACSNGIFAYLGFQQSLFGMSKVLAERRPSFEWSAKPAKHWEREMRFRYLGEMFWGVSVERILARDSANLDHWVSLLRAGGTEVRALIAKDDPLNPPPGVGSYRVIAAYRPDEILVLTRGGHLGFRGTREYRKILRAQFRTGESRSDPGAGAPDDALDDDAKPARDSIDAEEKSREEAF